MLRLWLRSDLRSRWRSLLLVAIIAGATSAAVLGAVAGARRTTGSFERFVDSSREPQAYTFAFDEATARRAGEVMASGALAVGTAVQLRALPAGVDTGGAVEFSVFASTDAAFDDRMSVPKVVSGRLASGPDEMVVNEALARAHDLRPGSRLAMVGYSPTAIEACSAADSSVCAPDVQLGDATVVGIIRRPGDLSPESAGAQNIELSGALSAKWMPLVAESGWLTMARYPADYDPDVLQARLTAALGADRVTGDSADVFIETRNEADPERVDSGLRVERNGLLAFALIAALGGLVAIPQAIARHRGAARGDLSSMRALGMRGRDDALLAVTTAAVAGVFGAILAVIAAIALSPMLPIGLARQAEPDVGVHADWPVLGMGAALTVLVTIAAGVSTLRSPRRVGKPAASAGVLDRLGPAAAAGSRFALDRRVSLATSAVATTVLGVAVVAGVLVFRSSQSHLVEHAGLYGASWDVQIPLVPDQADAALAATLREPHVGASALLRSGRVRLDGSDVPAVTMVPGRGLLEQTMLSGSAVRRDGEAVLSGALLDELGLHVGDRIQVGEQAIDLTIVGRGIRPQVGIYSGDEGIVMAPDDFDRVAFGNDIEGEGGVELAVRASAGTSVQQLRDALRPISGGFDREIAASFRPADISNIERVRSVSAAVAVVAGALAAVALVHALLVAAVRRRKDLAVLRALGMTARQSRSVMWWHGAVVAMPAVLLGVPVGWLAGRTAWGAIAHSMQVVDAPSVPVAALILLTVLTTFAAWLVGVVSGRWGVEGPVAIAVEVGVAMLAVLGVVTGLWVVAGIVIALRHRCPAAGLVLALGVVGGLGAGAWAADVHGSPTDFGAALVDVTVRLALVATPAIVFHLTMTLPDGRAARRAHHRFVLIGYGVALAVGVGLVSERDHVVRWPVAVLWILALSALPVAHTRYRRAGAVDQRRLQWIGWSAVVALEVVLVCGALTLLADWPHHSGEVSLAATGLVPLAMIAATVPRLLARVDRLLTHTVSLTGLTALVGAAYVIALAAFGRKPDGSERSLLLLSMLAAAGAALAYQPARAWLSDHANRIVYGERSSPDETLRTWGSRLTRAIPLDELLLQLAETLRKSLRLRSAEIWTGSNGSYELAASVPHRGPTVLTVGHKERSVVSRAGVSGGTWLDIWLPGVVDAADSSATRVAPIAHAGELLGLIVCRRNPDAEAFTEEDDRVLTELARQVGLALHNVQLDTALQASLDELRQTNEELRASRSRIVAAGDAERRKLERNLHDGAQQHLVALAVKLRLARDAVVEDPADAEAMIDEVRGNLQEAIAELRSLAHGIFPPLLMSGGLTEALPAAAARAALPTTAEVTEIGRYSPDVEAAVYFCCSEALQNAGKHAGPTAAATLRVWQNNGSLHWMVADDGPGFDAALAAAGHGFVNMRDRMGAFGGTLEVVSSPGTGTTIAGSVPLN